MLANFLTTVFGLMDTCTPQYWYRYLLAFFPFPILSFSLHRYDLTLHLNLQYFDCSLASYLSLILTIFHALIILISFQTTQISSHLVWTSHASVFISLLLIFTNISKIIPWFIDEIFTLANLFFLMLSQHYLLIT